MQDATIAPTPDRPTVPGRLTVVGAGIVGLWQALTLRRAGFEVRLVDRSEVPFADAASAYAGAMIAPFCEAESAPDIVRDLGRHGAEIWRRTAAGLIENGTLVVAAPRDQGELRRFARATTGHELVAVERLRFLEPELADRFATALYFQNEAHMTTPDVLQHLLDLCREAGVGTAFGVVVDDARLSSTDQPAKITDPDASAGSDWMIDCRGMGARDVFPELRGVRGERLVVRARGVGLSRAVRLLHPRHPLYVVPWTDDRYMIGATVIESDDASPMSVRSALELLGLAYALHPGFGEAEILEMTAGVRPSFADNVPRIMFDPSRRLVRVNGAYRHGFLLAPVLAELVESRFSDPNVRSPLLTETTAVL